jgi:hypothetical protein
MGKNNGNSNSDNSKDNGGIVDINEYLEQQGYIVQRRPDTTGFVGGMPIDTAVSSDFFEDLNKQTLASLS